MSHLSLLCMSADGHNIFYDPTHSHAATHFNDAPGLKELAIEILSHRQIANNPLEFDVDMGKPVGAKDVVEVGEGDELLYAKRLNREEYVPFVKNRQPQPCSIVAISLRAQNDGYVLHSAWIGEFAAPPFPSGDAASQESIDFWNRHAFVWGSQAVQPETVTTDCPW